ncbi:hypothetical protein A3D05_02245 [Candidatus Gottesmanbacteria bacterium RIFCSPHIGHO2_02_FULL_40_24]|uniref:NH(3)-dependent NAD(+) synthetase n=1 Tax=Candidatus Gottesmanbacteria bacterium RIFCSPHIGHO2_01_FULL_40_15 TaxID=1798376 RepID=A0A1F5Z3K5_9BACT|nr:MAG: hypothetical protein A2777_04010 [Candidatus Gottesmanbacteria bacterium RIFCSPHIGHO2_01_FULL_40_15]OGG18673.1 MAG: hypothetical protein A3D05_02245 [Candidatus Gottesmanbacteria bacterium RIFCSPHIGHO2_02_FULL_40_24]OGG22784.1 MAG: hypothetical protein A3B48_05320 [Candidatus Gottesmanbacteria bacterium RIFCSPLOWO2_01_FULL_40_10]OGG22965.1 MAG: hypothetical protein A3E42_06450 [Candidatus Gottesmanbacteria bacterium RIFCSPHIGHO2_12_FULL_40_13]OGG31884.1 MAG: hypothetical protein A3I80_0
MNQNINLTLNPKKESEKIVKFIRESVNKAGFSKAVIGLSGGIDSATSLVLAVKALGSQNVIGAILPYGDWQKEALDDIFELTGNVKLPERNLIKTDIKGAVDEIVDLDSSINELRKGNIIVRVRMIILYDLSKKYGALVMGTENKTEFLLGYFTRFGDEASDLEPIRGLYKTQVRRLAEYLKVPTKIIRKAPSAGMWPGQTDEGEMGFTYEKADSILYLFTDKKLSKNEIISRGFDSAVVEKVLKRLEDNEFKHQIPYIIEIEK